MHSFEPAPYIPACMCMCECVHWVHRIELYMDSVFGVAFAYRIESFARCAFRLVRISHIRSIHE